MNNQPYFLHHHLAEQADSRLAIVRHTPKHIILVGADGDFSRQKLAARYPQAKFSEYDPHPERLQHAAAQRQHGLLHKITGKHIAQHAQSPQDRLPEHHADMLWSNLNLVWADDLPATLSNWAQALQKDGLLFFTHFGADSLPEIRQIIDAPHFLLRDMHDVGDMLFHHGFYDPIMDTAQLHLDYENFATLQHDLQFTGLWRSLNVANADQAWQTLRHAWDKGALRQIRVEILHGHAIKKTVLPENEHVLQFYPRKMP